ncbi:Uncharacterised protein [Klebsiella pneumoniae]|nr:Uncharacterised protein [Klebsiella pneumoniae]
MELFIENGILRVQCRCQLNGVCQCILMRGVILLQVDHGIARTGDFVITGIHIHHKAGRGDTNQNQHNQTDTFLPVVCTV